MKRYHAEFEIPAGCQRKIRTDSPQRALEALHRNHAEIWDTIGRRYLTEDELRTAIARSA
ncbi:hypothetical protein LCGC14_1848120 [marine sediment metagenome]|uniref:Uncharacterized protein n=1 Tax=marine sediment metagenome TaxID=412755 RepID=A0A0F9IQS1_9ZZZZ